MRPEQTLWPATGLEQSETQKDCISHADPDRPGEIPICGDTLYHKPNKSHVVISQIRNFYLER